MNRSLRDERRDDERRRKIRNRLIVLAIVLILIVPIPRSGGVWYLNGLLFRFFDWVNANFLPENF